MPNSLAQRRVTSLESIEIGEQVVPRVEFLQTTKKFPELQFRVSQDKGVDQI
jgi:hypothetical protein